MNLIQKGTFGVRCHAKARTPKDTITMFILLQGIGIVAFHASAWNDSSIHFNNKYFVLQSKYSVAQGGAL